MALSSARRKREDEFDPLRLLVRDPERPRRNSTSLSFKEDKGSTAEILYTREEKKNQ